jgi:bifunctional non-homologous end joining protein LigD
MLARSGPIPTRGDWAFEVKWDGFRANVSTEGAPLRVRSRRGWNMTDLVPELAALPIAATLDDGELVAFGPDGAPDFPLLCDRLLDDDLFLYRAGFFVDGHRLAAEGVHRMI